METVNFEVRYEAGHSYKEPWVRTKWFCLACGKPSVWCRNDGGDYYAGELYMCSACGADFHLPGEPNTNHERDWQARQRLEHLRASVSTGGGNG